MVSDWISAVFWELLEIISTLSTNSLFVNYFLRAWSAGRCLRLTLSYFFKYHE